ncbi:hypothetical protein BS78_05G261100 [Paspalum vaginatum]|nr:hypothetical protein BS78_05G261100 [Paspalum vaginatum]
MTILPMAPPVHPSFPLLSLPAAGEQARRAAAAAPAPAATLGSFVLLRLMDRAYAATAPSPSPPWRTTSGCSRSAREPPGSCTRPGTAARARRSPSSGSARAGATARWARRSRPRSGARCAASRPAAATRASSRSAPRTSRSTLTAPAPVKRSSSWTTPGAARRRSCGRTARDGRSPSLRTAVMRALLEGAAALHARGVLHRDIKPANVLLDARGGVRICDFGRSRPTTARSGTSSSPLTPGVATLWYGAPELILGSRDYDAGVDAWALGCVMAELLSGAPLFPGSSEMDQLNRVFDTLGAQDVASWRGSASLPRAGNALCRRPRPPARLRGMFPALSDAGFRVLAGLLECRPDRRLTAADALRCPWFDAEDPAAAAEAVALAAAVDQPRASSSCSAGFSAAAGGVTVHGVAAEAMVA